MAEAKITGRLQHPGVPAVYHVGELPGGRPFLAMKLIKGQTLADLLRAGTDRGKLVAAFEGVCQAVGYAHAHGVVHRDLKPANVMVGAFGEVQVMDWGLAKVLAAGPREADPGGDETTPATEIADDRDQSDATRDGTALGTPAYMPPEQAVGAVADMDARSDVFGLGAVLCALLTGQPPYVGADAGSTRQLAARAKLTDAYDRLDACGADPDLVALCKRCLSADRAERPADAGEVAAAVAALRRAADERARAAEVERGRAAVREAEGRRRRRAGQRAAGVGAAILLVGVGGTTAGLVRAETARRAEAGQRRAAEDKEEEAAEVLRFVQDAVFAAGRPTGQEGGLGHDIRLKDAVAASLPALAERFAGRPMVEARLRATLGETFRLLGEAGTAAEQLERARELFLARHGPDHPASLACLNNLANCYDALGRRADAARHREEALAGRRRALGPDAEETVWAMSDLAVSYAGLGRHADALRLRDEVLAARRRDHPPDHPAVLSGMASLANSYTDLGRRADALRLQEEVLAGRRRALPPDHPDTLWIMNNLANSYAAVGRPADAVRLHEEALAGRLRALPADHPDTLASLTNLANSYADQGRHADAVRLHEQVLAVQRRANPPDHPGTLGSLTNLVGVYADLGRHADALRVCGEAVAGRERVAAARPGDLTNRRFLGALHADTGNVLKAMNRPADGLPAYDRAAAELRAVLAREPDDALARQYLRNVHADRADALDRLGRPAEAVADWDRAVESDLGPNRPFLQAKRATSRARAGQAATAVAEVDVMTTGGNWSAAQWYDFACVYAVAGDTLPDRRAEYAARAVALLRKAVAAGWADAAHMGADPDLAPLRDRLDFRWLLATLKAKHNPPERAPAPAR